MLESGALRNVSLLFLLVSEYIYSELKISIMYNSKDNIIAGLELVLSTIVPAATNKWISVKDLSIVKTLKEAGVNWRYSSVIQDVLKKKGLMFTEGAKGGMRFTIKAQVTYDFAGLAKEVYQQFNDIVKGRGKSSTDGYPYSKSSDLKPKKPKEAKTIGIYETSSSPRTIKRRIILPNMNDLVFVFHAGTIYQAVVTGMSRDLNAHSASQDNKNNVRYTVTIIDKDSSKDLQDVVELKTIVNVLPKDIFNSIEEAANFVIRQAVYFPKDFLKNLNL